MGGVPPFVFAPTATRCGLGASSELRWEDGLGDDGPSCAASAAWLGRTGGSFGLDGHGWCLRLFCFGVPFFDPPSPPPFSRGANSGRSFSRFFSFFFLILMAAAPPAAIPAPVGRAFTGPGSMVKMGLGPIGRGLGIPMGGMSIGFKFRCPVCDKFEVLLFRYEILDYITLTKFS